VIARNSGSPVRTGEPWSQAVAITDLTGQLSMPWRANYVDNSMSIVTATIDAINAIASHDSERLMPKPTSATMSHAAAANSAISLNPFNVIIALS
jgi:hypothetical protein